MSTMTHNQMIIEVEGNLDAAHRRASEMGGDTLRLVLPVRVFKQGNRVMVSGVLPIRLLSQILTYQASTRGGTANKASLETNRPVIPGHTKTIADYLVNALTKGEQYIIPPMTLNATRDLVVFVSTGGSDFRSGFAVLPEEQYLIITDGMHRFRAIQQAEERLHGTEEGNSFASDGIPVMITYESKLEQVHQDFADAGKTKALPPSLMAVFDARQPANQVVHQLADNVKLFHDRIDATSNTLSNQSAYLFLVNQVRQFVKSSLSGVPSLNDDTFARHASAALSNPTALKSFVDSRVIFLDTVTDLIPEWKTIASLPTPSGAEGPKTLAEMKKLREKNSVSLSAAALNTLGLVSHTILSKLDTTKKKEALEEDLKKQLEPLRQVKWNREAEIWRGNLVQMGEDKNGEPKLLIKTQTPSIKQAHLNLLNVLNVT